MRGEKRGYDIKVLLIAIAEIMKLSGGNMSTAYKALQKMANAEGVILDPYQGTPDEKTETPE